MSVAKARISMCNDKGADEGQYSFYVQFNPNQFKIDENVGEAVRKHVGVPKADKGGRQLSPSEMQMLPVDEFKSIRFSTTLFFNTYNSAADYGDVRMLLNKFNVFLNKEKRNEKELKRIRFSWGSIQVFGLLTSMSVSYTMFASNGYPVRAEASITIIGDYVRYKSTKDYKAKEHGAAPAEKFSGFAAALNAYGSMDKLKTASRADGITNGRMQK